MDKYEFNIKVEQIKKMVNKEDFATAMKIADTIDWRRVRNANLLSTISQVYEKNGEYQESKEVLLLAFERAPIGKRFLYKLTELALKEGSLREAEDYYREFCELAPDDTRQYILRYLILKGKNASTDQLIQALERYINVELDEKRMYELAELYAKAGRTDACVQLCDKMILLFGVGTYVEKAGELKQRYAQTDNTRRQTAQMPGRTVYGGNVIQMPGTSAYNGNWQTSGGEYGNGPAGYETGNGYGTGYGSENSYGTGSGYGAAGSYAADQGYGPESSYDQGTGYGSGGSYNLQESYRQETGYGTLNGYGPENGYGSQEGYSGERDYVPGDGYGAENSYGSQGGYGPQNSYGAETSYNSQNSYGAETDYNAQNSYGEETGYNVPNSYGEETVYNVPNSYGAETGYNAQNSYGAETGYNTRNIYRGGVGYNSQNSYGTEAGYDFQNGYGTEAGYNPPNGYGAEADYNSQNSYETETGYGRGNGFAAVPRYDSQPGHGMGSGYGGVDHYRDDSVYDAQDAYETNPAYGSDEDYGMDAGNGYVPEGDYNDREYMPYNRAHEVYGREEAYEDRAGYGAGGGYEDNSGYDMEPWQEAGEEQSRQRPTGYGAREYGYGNPHGGYPQAGPYVVDEEMMANLHQAAAEKELAAEMSRISTEEYMEPEPASNQTRVFRGKNNVRILRPREEEERPFYTRSYTPHHMIIEAKTAQEGFGMAVEELKKIHQETGVDNAVIKISGSKLSKRGIFNVSDKLSGKDLIVEEAGDLTQRDLEELQMLLERDETGMIVVLIDSPHQIVELHQQNPGFINLFKCIGPEKYVEETVEPEEEQIQEEPYYPQEQESPASQTEASSKPVQEPEMMPSKEETVSQPETELQPEAEDESQPEQEPEEVQPQSEEDTETASLQEENEPQEFTDSQDEEEVPENLPAESEDVSAEDTHDPEEEQGRQDEDEEENYLEEEYPDAGYPDEDYPEDDLYQDDYEYEDVGPDGEAEDEVIDEDEYGGHEYEEQEPVDDDEELGIDAFADYAVQYANDIDCSITGKSLLALYEKVEVMEENGIPLTRANAEDMIEEAADKAEKPSLGGLLKGVFSSKYDKEGLLILKEEHFV